MIRWAGLEGDPRAATANRLALMAGQMALERVRYAERSWKLDGSLVTDVDVLIQDRLGSEIRRRFPEDGLLGEEGGAAHQGPSGARCWWVLDPLDGTNNFGRGLPGFTISVGVLQDGMPHAGAVYDPVCGWLFSACAGRGAWLNGRRLAVRSEPLSTRSLFVVRTPYDGGIPPYVQAWLGRYRLRRFGSTALHLCYVALGGLAFVHDHRASLWDLAGAAPVLIEADGILTRADGLPLFPIHPARYVGEPLGLLAGNPLSHRESLEQITTDMAAERLSLGSGRG